MLAVDQVCYTYIRNKDFVSLKQFLELYQEVYSVVGILLWKLCLHSYQNIMISSFEWHQISHRFLSFESAMIHFYLSNSNVEFYSGMTNILEKGDLISQLDRYILLCYLFASFYFRKGYLSQAREYLEYGFAKIQDQNHVLFTLYFKKYVQILYQFRDFDTLKLYEFVPLVKKILDWNKTEK